MGACATKPKTLEGKAPVETSKVETETTISTDQVAADQTPGKVVEKAKEEPTAAELPANVADQKAELTTPEANNKGKVEEKIVEEEKPSAPVEEKTAVEVVEKTMEAKSAEEKEKPTQS